MSASKKSFEFTEQGAFEANMEAFFTHMGQEDTALAADLQSQFKALSQGGYKQQDILNGLLAAAENPSPPTNVSPSAAVVAGQSATSAAAAISATGWLLEGLSIEGFRGINNQGKPLELKFHADKVNSISAVNGVGKSSVYDAVRYAICGEVPWLEGLPASERGTDYYLNKFNTSGTATITLKLVAEPSGEQVTITVKRDAQGNRTVSSTPAADAEGILQSLNREFVLLDGHAFQNFISAKPLDRGRTFSGLLGLAQYSAMRQSLAAIANTRAFNNHFAVAEHAQLRGREEKGAADARAAIASDYEALVGQPLGAQSSADAQASCHLALEQIGPLKPLCENRVFHDIDINACIEAVKAAEGGPKRDRLSECIRERADLKKLNVEAPKSERAAALVSLAEARDRALAETVGDVMLSLFQAGQKALGLPDWSDPTLCPLCDQKGSHDLKAHIASKLSQFDTLEQAGTAIAKEWGEAGWSDLVGLEAKLEDGGDHRVIAKLRPSAEKGELGSKDAESLAEWLKTLRSRADQKERGLATEQAALEKELPPSSVEVTRKVEAARRLQANWRKLTEAETAAGQEQTREALVAQVKRFLDSASDCFGAAEGALSKARLTAVEPVFKSYFNKLSFFGVVPKVTKRANSEDLQIALADFHGLPNLSPQALLSESFRNAFAISLYLAAASLYGGLPKFIVLDDVTSSFDAGHQNFLVELLRTTFARPANASGLQVILLSHDTMLEKLFNKHSNTGTWWHQRLEGVPQLAVLPQAGAVNKVRDQTLSMLQAGQVDFAKEGVRQYLEYRLSDLISRLRIPVPVDVAFNDNKQLAHEFLQAIEAAIKLNQAAKSLVLDSTQVSGLNANMATIVGNFLSHWGTGQTLSFSGPSLLGVMQSIDQYCECFMFVPSPGAPRQFYKSLNQKS
ncbi:AAA family ATPase [Bradyrhizobium sp.]|uniref:AAA family ATPase n=1 Tax=Bradyrhizobium sp. TaxID=376 RepID=UPI0039E6B511